jgi:hypothetical protein
MAATSQDAGMQQQVSEQATRQHVTIQQAVTEQHSCACTAVVFKLYLALCMMSHATQQTVLPCCGTTSSISGWRFTARPTAAAAALLEHYFTLYFMPLFTHEYSVSHSPVAVLPAASGVLLHCRVTAAAAVIFQKLLRMLLHNQDYC